MQRENKMEYLIELTKLQSMGIALSFEPSMDIPLWKLKHEYQQHDAQQTLLTRVSIVKKGIKMATLLLSTFAGKFLKLEGWSEYVHGELDTGVYDSALEQIYRTVAGRGRPNCWAQVIMLVLGTGICYHIHNAHHEAGVSPSGENIVFKMFSFANKAMDVLKPGGMGGGAAGNRRSATAAPSRDRRSAPPDGAGAGHGTEAADGDASAGANPALGDTTPLPPPSAVTPGDASATRIRIPRRADRMRP
jgi:hypothetical protein